MKQFKQYDDESIIYRQSVTNDRMTNSTWSISPAGPAVVDKGRTDVDALAQVSGLSSGTTYTLKCLVVTVTGQTLSGRALITCP